MAGTRVGRPVRRCLVCPRATTPPAGAQVKAKRSRARARRAPPRSSMEVRRPAARRARPTPARARPEARQVPLRPEGPTPAARLRALPTTEVVLRVERPARQARAAAAQLRAAAAEGAAWLPEAEGAARPRPAAEAAQLPAEQ